MAKKKKKQHVGTISALELIKKSAPMQDIPFRTGRYITKKDRPRDKNWRNWKEE